MTTRANPFATAIFLLPLCIGLWIGIVSCGQAVYAQEQRLLARGDSQSSLRESSRTAAADAGDSIDREKGVVPESGEAGDKTGNVQYAKIASDAANGFHLGATPSFSHSQLALILGSSLDTLGTLYALTVNPQASEANPVLAHGGTTGFLIGKTASTAALAWAVGKIEKSHPRIAKVIGFGGGFSLGMLAARNVTVAK